jgi:CheY-like chemotaxis protein
MEPRDTILVVDDTAAVADLLREVLGGAGYRVLVAPTLEIGLTILAAFVVRLVLIDAPPPADDASDAGDFWAEPDRLARAARQIPLIVYAGGNAERHADYASHGYAAHLTKPLDLDALVAMIAGLLPAERSQSPIANGTAAEGRGHAQQEVV